MTEHLTDAEQVRYGFPANEGEGTGTVFSVQAVEAILAAREKALREQIAQADQEAFEREERWQQTHREVTDLLVQAEAERDRHGPCICNTGPSTDGPDEFCPRHGRPYDEVLAMLARLNADLRVLREGITRLADEWEETCLGTICNSCGADNFSGASKFADSLRTLLGGESNE